MRILFTTAWYPNRKVAGDGVFVQKHAQAIARLNDVAVLMVQTDINVSGWRIELEDITSEVTGTLKEVLVYVPKTTFEVPVLTGLIRLAWLMSGYLKGYRYIRRTYWHGERPEVCHVNVLTRAAGLPWLLKRIHKIPYIITEHWSRYARPEAYPNSSLQHRLGRLFVKDAAYVCPVSLNLEQAMKKWKLENRHYTRVSNVINTDVFSLPSAPTSLDDSTVRFVHVSWMRDDAKNISGILRVLSELKKLRRDFHFDFIGEGNDKSSLMQYAETLGLFDGDTPEVSFLPARSGESLAKALQQHDAMVMFSNFENQPVSVLEALSCGLPVISTRVGVVPSMLAQQRGLILEPGDEAQLLVMLESFIKLRKSMTPEQRADRLLAEARHRYVVDHHGPEVIGRQFDALYHSATKQK